MTEPHSESVPEARGLPPEEVAIRIEAVVQQQREHRGRDHHRAELRKVLEQSAAHEKE